MLADNNGWISRKTVSLGSLLLSTMNGSRASYFGCMEPNDNNSEELSANFVIDIPEW